MRDSGFQNQFIKQATVEELVHKIGEGRRLQNQFITKSSVSKTITKNLSTECVMNWSCSLLHSPILCTGSGCRKHTELLTEVTVGQTFEKTRLLTTRWTADGGGEVGDVGLCHLQGHLTTAAHRQLGPLAWLTRWGSKGTIQVKAVTTWTSQVCHHVQHRLFIMTGETVNTQSCLSSRTTQTVHHDRRNSKHPVMSVITYNTDCSSWQEKQ